MDRSDGLLVDTARWVGSTPISDLVLPALLLRVPDLPWSQVVSVYVPSGRTVAFSARDRHTSGMEAASAIAQAAGFHAVVRSPGGRMVAYDSGAVVIDHLFRTAGLAEGANRTFAENARHHLDLLTRLGVLDARVGEVDGEYCPGEFSINVAGRAKVVGSAQRVTKGCSLFSTVIQVSMSEQVRTTIVAVSEALGYPLRGSAITGLREHGLALTARELAAAIRHDYATRYGLAPGRLPPGVLRHALRASDASPVGLFRVDDWCRANPVVLP